MDNKDLELLRWKIEARRMKRVLFGIQSLYEIIVIALVMAALFLWFVTRHNIKTMGEEIKQQTELMQQQLKQNHDEHVERMERMRQMEHQIKDQERRKNGGDK